MIRDTLELVAKSIGGTLTKTDDGYLIESRITKDGSFLVRFYYSLDGTIQKTTLI